MHPISLVTLPTARGATPLSPRQATINYNPVSSHVSPASSSPISHRKLPSALTDGSILSREQVALPISLTNFNYEPDTSAITTKIPLSAIIQDLRLTTQIFGTMHETGRQGIDSSAMGNGER